MLQGVQCSRAKVDLVSGEGHLVAQCLQLECPQMLARHTSTRPAVAIGNEPAKSHAMGRDGWRGARRLGYYIDPSS
jgi:hypothetical protein